MKYKDVIASLQVLIISMGVFSGMTVSASPQGMCVAEALVVTNMSGKVVSLLEKGESPLTQATVTLLEDRYQGRVVTETTVGEGGYFQFSKKVKPGKYVLKVSHPNLATFYGRVRLTSARGQSSQQELVVTLGADFTKPCGGSFAALRIKKDK